MAYLGGPVAALGASRSNPAFEIREPRTQDRVPAELDGASSGRSGCQPALLTGSPAMPRAPGPTALRPDGPQGARRPQGGLWLPDGWALLSNWRVGGILFQPPPINACVEALTSPFAVDGTQHPSPET